MRPDVVIIDISKGLCEFKRGRREDRVLPYGKCQFDFLNFFCTYSVRL